MSLLTVVSGVLSASSLALVVTNPLDAVTKAAENPAKKQEAKGVAMHEIWVWYNAETIDNQIRKGVISITREFVEQECSTNPVISKLGTLVRTVALGPDSDIGLSIEVFLATRETPEKRRLLNGYREKLETAILEFFRALKPPMPRFTLAFGFTDKVSVAIWDEPSVEP